MLALLLAAQLAGPPAPPVRTDYLRVEETLPPLMLGAALDLWSTGYRFRVDAGRVADFYGRSVEERAALQLAWVGTGIWVVHEADRRWGRRWGVRFLVAILAVKVGVSVRNLTMEPK